MSFVYAFPPLVQSSQDDSPQTCTQALYSRFSSVQACKAADDLKANLEEEYVAVRAFIVEFCKCMDYIQHAKMLVSGCEHSHTYTL